VSSSKITIKDVAKKAGVSIATVSRYLNNSPLKEENRQKIAIAVKELNYQPALYARRLAGGKLDSFGLIIPGYEGIFYSYYALEIIREIAIALTEDSIDLHLNIFWDKDNFKSSLVDGVIMADIIGNENQLKRLIKDNIPVVIMNRKVEDYDVNCVAVDNFKGAYEATDFLIQHGHKQIAHLAGDLRVQAAQDRLDGYKSALAKQGIEVKKDYIKITNFSPKEAWERLEELFSQKTPPPTAIFCCSDEVASKVLNFAEERKIDIPNKLSVIGFDDNPNCLYGSLMLTTIRQPLKTMVRKAVQILKESLKGQQSPQKIVLDTELIIRDTVGFI
jgi:LacI family transcriptional regulator